MADTTKVVEGVQGADDARKAKRRNRLQSLIGRRTEQAAATAVPAAARPGPGAGGGLGGALGGGLGSGAGAALLGEGAGGDVQARRKALARIYRLLTDTPPDAAGMVEGTPFSHAGVARLMDMLRSRAANEGQAGARVAAGLIKFLTPQEDGAQVHGASLDRLQRIAKTAGGLMAARGPGGKAGRGGNH